MTSTYDLISHIPGYMIEILSSRILGQAVDTVKLAEGLSDEMRLKRLLDGLSARQRSLLMDLYDFGGNVQWDVLTALYRDSSAELREDLSLLGAQGLVFQGGLSGRDPLILLPALTPFLEQIRSLSVKETASSTWKDLWQVNLWGHVALLNTLKSSRIRCRTGMEPFKRGWEYLEEKLSGMLDVTRIYWELVELGCIIEKKGVLCVSQQAASELTMEGDMRYPLWRFIISCRPYQGLDHKVFSVITDHAVSRDHLIRSMLLFLVSKDPEEHVSYETIHTLIDLWISLGILKEDSTSGWVCFPEAVYRALKTGIIESGLRAYSEEVVIQPNMEILVPGDFDPVDLLNLGEIADIVQMDVVSIYRLSRRSVSRGIKEGWTYDKMRGFLERISRHELPDNVSKTIEGWASSRVEAHIIRGTFLVLTGEECKANHGMKEVLPGIYRIPDNCEEEVIAFLDKKDVLVQGSDMEADSEEGISWGKITPFQSVQKASWKESRKDGVFPFGMVSPLPYGPKGEGLFEQALHEGGSIIIFYPRQGYGEIEVKKISPIYIYRKGGVPFVEAFCEDTGEGEVFDITKVRALLRDA